MMINLKPVAEAATPHGMVGALWGGMGATGHVGIMYRSALSFAQRMHASALVRQKYLQRGYLSASRPQLPPDQELLTLTAEADEAVRGTLSVRFDSAAGLAADRTFAAEMALLRGRKRSLCEFTRLAMDLNESSQPVLARLMHRAYLHAYRLRGVEALVMEVNPRHVPYYRRMLGCHVVGSVRLNPTVNAPAVLMSLDFVHAQEQIDRFRQQPALAATARNLYPHCFSLQDEIRLLQEMQAQL